nr:MAG TPA: hypothetical protein [Caudoviricetes sp.]
MTNAYFKKMVFIEIRLSCFFYRFEIISNYSKPY